MSIACWSAACQGHICPAPGDRRRINCFQLSRDVLWETLLCLLHSAKKFLCLSIKKALLPVSKCDIGETLYIEENSPTPLSVANLDLKMMKSSLLLLLLINIALASTLDNAPGKETNRVRRRGQSSTDASAKRTQFKEECGDDAACVRQKMREWRKTKQATESFDRIRRRGTSSTDASSKRTQFVEECGEDAACVRQKMREWRKARKAGGEARKF